MRWATKLVILHHCLVALFFLTWQGELVAGEPRANFPQLIGENGEKVDGGPIASYLDHVSRWRNVSLVYELVIPTYDKKGDPLDVVVRSKILIGPKSLFLLEHKVSATRGQEQVVGRSPLNYYWYDTGSFVMARSDKAFYLLQDKSGRLIVYNLEEEKNASDIDSNLLAITKGFRHPEPVFSPLNNLFDFGSMVTDSMPIWDVLGSPSGMWAHIVRDAFSSSLGVDGGISYRGRSKDSEEDSRYFSMRREEKIGGAYVFDIYEFKSQYLVNGKEVERKWRTQYFYKFFDASEAVNGVPCMAVFDEIIQRQPAFGQTAELMLKWKLVKCTVFDHALSPTDFVVDFDLAKEIVDYKTGLSIEP